MVDDELLKKVREELAGLPKKKSPVPGTELNPDSSEICVYKKHLELNSGDSSTIRDMIKSENAENCKKCTGYSPINPETKMPYCPYYNPVPLKSE